MSQLSSLWHYLNASPNFVPSVVGVAAAFFGSWGAQIAILRREHRLEVIAKVNAVNEAQALCFTIANGYLGLKKQNVKSMVERYRQVAANYEAYLLQQANAKIKHPFHYEADLESLPLVKVPVALLERTIFDKLGPGSKIMAVTVELMRSIDGLEDCIRARNDYLAKLYQGPALEPMQFLGRYLGLQQASGVDAQYRSLLFGIESYCNDCIFFSKTLSELLAEYGKKFRRKHRHHIFWRIPRIETHDYSSEQARALLPDGAEYENYLSGFVPQPTKWQQVKGILQRIKALFSSKKKADHSSRKS